MQEIDEILFFLTSFGYGDIVITKTFQPKSAIYLCRGTRRSLEDLSASPMSRRSEKALYKNFMA